MANVFFALKLTWATVTNDIRVSVYNVTDTATPIAFVQHAAPHLDQQYDFPGLPRVNFIYKVQEYSIGGSTLISQLGQATFVPANDELFYKSPVDIHIGTTQIEGDEPNVWTIGSTSVTIPGWIGQEIIFGRNGVQYPMRKGLDYSWDATTGELNLLQLGDSFQNEWFHAEFETIIQASSGGVSGGAGTNGFSDIRVITATTTLDAADIGKKILIIPSGNYLEVTLPDYTGIEANKITYFEMQGGNQKCARIKPFTAQSINWFNSNNLFICSGESFESYKRVISTGNYEWRLQSLEGNFKTVGELCFNDYSEGNMLQLDGSNKDYQQFARLYDWILRSGMGITYTSWSSANIFTRMKFSLKDTASSNFRVPDIKTNPGYMRPAGAGSIQTDWISQKILQHQHMQSIGSLPTPPFGKTAGTQHSVIGNYNDVSDTFYDLTSRSVQLSVATGLYEIIDGSENNPNSRVSNLYVRI